MGNRLKHFRVAAGMTQKRIAEAVGITQPTYQRWETGAVPIPDGKLARLAQALNTTREALLGRHLPARATFSSDDTQEDLQCYGDVAVHFCGGGEPLLLSISEEARSHLIRDLQSDLACVSIRDLGNRTVMIRRSAISDLYLSSDAYDDRGPEDRKPGYKVGTPLHLPDTRDWEIIESLASESVGIEDFALDDVDRVTKAVMRANDQHTRPAADRPNKPKDPATEKLGKLALTPDIFEMATSVVYQLSNGKRRRVGCVDCNLYDVFGPWVDDGVDSAILLQSEGYDRSVFIGPDSWDYISVPTHLFEKGRDETTAALLDALDESSASDGPADDAFPGEKSAHRGRRQARANHSDR